MNFKKNLFCGLFPILIFSSCGVKGPPSVPSGKHIEPWAKDFVKVPILIKKRNRFDNNLKDKFELKHSLNSSLNSLDKSFVEYHSPSKASTKKIKIPNWQKEIKKHCLLSKKLRKDLLLSNKKLLASYIQYKKEENHYFETKSEYQVIKHKKILEKLNENIDFETINQEDHAIAMRLEQCKSF